MGKSPATIPYRSSGKQAQTAKKSTMVSVTVGVLGIPPRWTAQAVAYTRVLTLGPTRTARGSNAHASGRPAM